MLLNSLVNIVFPYYCFSCRKLGKPVCDSCVKTLSHLSKRVSKQDGVVSFFRYSGVCKKALRGAKYFSVKEALMQLCREAPIHTLRFDQDWVLVPVPLHKKRLRERGFNQALVIADYVSGITGLRVDQCVARKLHTPKQAQLMASERARNIKGAFITTRDPPENVIIIDDVWTTGSTAREMARVLRESGTRRIFVLTLAR